MSMPVAARILIVDDDPDIRDLIAQQVGRGGFKTASAASLTEARRALEGETFDLVILDLTLPDGDGVDLCREVRLAHRAEAIIMLTARDASLDRVLGLELGADDYLTKPFEPRELMARIRNILRRRTEGSDAGAAKRYAIFGPWKLDMVQRRLIASDGRLVMLSSAEYRLLERFIQRPHAVQSREALLPERRNLSPQDRAIDLQISRLRAKLAAPGDPLILTVRNEGYLFTADVSYE